MKKFLILASVTLITSVFVGCTNPYEDANEQHLAVDKDAMQLIQVYVPDTVRGKDAVVSELKADMSVQTEIKKEANSF